MKRNQNGSVLAISLVLLTVITLIAMMGLQRSALQTKIVVNIQHKECLFRTAVNDQEARYDRYNTAPEASTLLFDIINDFEVDAQGIKEQKGVDLTLDDLSIYCHGALITSTNLYIPGSSNSNKVTLAVGHDVGSHTNHYFQVDSTATYPNKPFIEEAQRTGFHFPALTIGQNSL